MLYHSLSVELTSLTQEINRLQLQLNNMPPGSLTITRNQTRYKWYVQLNKRKEYIPKSKKSLAELLAIKKYLILKLKELQHEHEFICSYMGAHPETHSPSEQLLLSPPYGKLLESYFQPHEQVLLNWSSSSYEQCEKYPEQLLHKSLSGNIVRSKSESFIDSSLFKNHIPFRYECLLQLGEISLYPDFTIMHPRTKNIFYWEHFGRMDDSSYARNAYSKLQLYNANRIIPSINLITTYETKEHPLSYDMVDKIIAYYFG